MTMQSDTRNFLPSSQNLANLFDSQNICSSLRTPSSLLPQKLDGSRSSRDGGYNSRSKFRINCKAKHIFTFFKFTLLIVNGLLILLILGGVIIYFTEFRENALKLTQREADNIWGDGSGGGSTGPKYAWVATTMVFALLLAIPCTGFMGALKEHVCLLVLYGVIFFVEAVVILIFKSFWFLFPALLTLCAMGLVFLIKTSKEGKDSRKSINWCLSKVWNKSLIISFHSHTFRFVSEVSVFLIQLFIQSLDTIFIHNSSWYNFWYKPFFTKNTQYSKLALKNVAIKLGREYLGIHFSHVIQSIPFFIIWFQFDSQNQTIIFFETVSWS